jgi:hypothetical protein
MHLLLHCCDRVSYIGDLLRPFVCRLALKRAATASESGAALQLKLSRLHGIAKASNKSRLQFLAVSSRHFADLESEGCGCEAQAPVTQPLDI